jgi:hypothetical protein
VTQESSILPYADIAYETPTEGLSVETSGAALLITGICPRCHHPTACSVPIGVITPGVAGIEAQNTEVTPDRYDTVIVCRCGYPHPNRPATEDGCGAFWRIGLEVQSE